MKRIILIRHGDCESSTGDLTPVGIRDIESLARFLKIHCEGPCQLLSSTVPRAQQSSAIIGRILGVDPESHEILWSGADSPAYEEDITSVMELVRNCKADVVLVVTHSEYLEMIAYFVGVRSMEVEKGEARVIDVDDKLLSTDKTGLLVSPRG